MFVPSWNYFDVFLVYLMSAFLEKKLASTERLPWNKASLEWAPLIKVPKVPMVEFRFLKKISSVSIYYNPSPLPPKLRN